MEINEESSERTQTPSETIQNKEEAVSTLREKTKATETEQGDSLVNGGLQDEEEEEMTKKMSKEKHAQNGPFAPLAESLSRRLGDGVRPTYLTSDGASWYIHVPAWWPCPSEEEMQDEWNRHPTEQHALHLFGKTVYENRWSQSFGVSYRYSGSENSAKDIDTEGGPMVRHLMDCVNALMQGLVVSEDAPSENAYTGCLQNWYEPYHTIGLHSDDESSQRRGYPIWSLSWGGPRRFLLRSRLEKGQKTEVWLKDGDLIIMGGTCQETHRHEVPKVRLTMDPPAFHRINWTIRAFVTPTTKRTTKKTSTSSNREAQKK